ncbi:hypothetical protein BC827DRAFT_1157985 [Russula dissimulans]|nr:hypothetical protein BC827DRAFT_1157985 [Russula dissimulans]
MYQGGGVPKSTLLHRPRYDDVVHSTLLCLVGVESTIRIREVSPSVAQVETTRRWSDGAPVGTGAATFICDGQEGVDVRQLDVISVLVDEPRRQDERREGSISDSHGATQLTVWPPTPPEYANRGRQRGPDTCIPASSTLSPAKSPTFVCGMPPAGYGLSCGDPWAKPVLWPSLIQWHGQPNISDQSNHPRGVPPATHRVILSVHLTVPLRATGRSPIQASKYLRVIGGYEAKYRSRRASDQDLYLIRVHTQPCCTAVTAKTVTAPFAAQKGTTVAALRCTLMVTWVVGGMWPENLCKEEGKESLGAKGEPRDVPFGLTPPAQSRLACTPQGGIAEIDNPARDLR